MKSQIRNTLNAKGVILPRILILSIISIVVVVMSMLFSSLLPSFMMTNSHLTFSTNPIIEVNNNFFKYADDLDNEMLRNTRGGVDSQISPMMVQDVSMESLDFDSAYFGGFNIILEEQRIYVNKTLLESLLSEFNITFEGIFEEHQVNISNYKDSQYNTHLYIEVFENCYESDFFQTNVCEKISIMSYEIPHHNMSYVFERIIFNNDDEIMG
ncbi:MAG: hypothetical protein ACMXYB_03550 [Candidatus Woesearchaeota archaeon]